MENKQKETKSFSNEILEFSKLTDKIFNKISTDVKDLKSNIDELKSDKELPTLKKNIKSNVDEFKKDISMLKNSLRVISNNTDKNNKKINTIINAQQRDINVLKSSIKRLENKLKIKD